MKNLPKIFFLKLLTMFFILNSHSLTAMPGDHPLADDKIITSKIEMKIALDKSISVFKVNVSTRHAIVYLKGVVDSFSQAESLINLAQETDGVIDVNTDHLKIKESKRPIVDTMLTMKVKSQLAKNKIDVSDMNVETNNGIVYLTGKAKNKGEIESAVKTAKLIKGIKHVESRLEVAK